MLGMAWMTACTFGNMIRKVAIGKELNPFGMTALCAGMCKE